MKISLPSTFDFAKTQSNGNDIRFTDSDGVTLLSYWIQSYSQTAKTGTIWVKVPALPAGAVTTIYMYYDNPSAAAASSGSGTFPFFSDFSDPAWTSLPAMPVTHTADETASLVNGKFYIIGGYNSTANKSSVVQLSVRSRHRHLHCHGPHADRSMGPHLRRDRQQDLCFRREYHQQQRQRGQPELQPGLPTNGRRMTPLPAAIAHQGITGCTDGTSMYLFYNNLAYRYNPCQPTIYTQLASMPAKLRC